MRSRKWSWSIVRNSSNRPQLYRNGLKRAHHRCHQKKTRQENKTLRHSVDGHLYTDRKVHEILVRGVAFGDLFGRGDTIYMVDIPKCFPATPISSKDAAAMHCGRFPDPKTTRWRIQHLEK